MMMEKFKGIDKHPIILQVGTMYTRYGLLGENAPRKVVITPDEVHDHIVTRFKVKAKNESDENTLKEIEQKLDNLLQRLYFQDLLVNPKDRPVIICENLFSSREVINILAKLLFSKYDAPKIFFFFENTLPLYVTGSFSGIVVDAGYLETHITPTVDGYPFVKALEHIPAGGEAIGTEIKRLLLLDNEKEPANKEAAKISKEDLEAYKINCLFVLSKEQKSQYFANEESVEKMKQKFYKIAEGSQLRISYYTRATACEVLFGDPENDDFNIAYSLLKCAKNLKLEVRAKVLQNIVLAGGAVMIPGFARRLREEMEDFLENCPEFAALKTHRATIAFSNYIYPPNIVSWIGASLIGGLQSLEKFAVYAENIAPTFEVPDRTGEAWLLAEPPASKAESEGQEEAKTAEK